MTYEEKIDADIAQEKRAEERAAKSTRQRIQEQMVERLSHISPAIPLHFTEPIIDEKPGRIVD